MTPGDRIREFITIAYDGSNNKCAEDIGISPQSLSQYIHGKRSLGKVMRVRFEKIGLNPAYVEYGQGEMFADNVEGMKARIKYNANKDEINENIVADSISNYVLSTENDGDADAKEKLKRKIIALEAKVEILSDIIIRLKNHE